MKLREMNSQSHINILWTIQKMWDQMQATSIHPYANGFYQLVSGCTQRFFFGRGHFHWPITNFFKSLDTLQGSAVVNVPLGGAEVLPSGPL